MKDIPRDKYRTLGKLLKDLHSALKYVSRTIQVPGTKSDDLYQELVLWIIKTYRKNPRYCSHRKLGWWFVCSKRTLFRMKAVAIKRNPLARAYNLSSALGEAETHVN